MNWSMLMYIAITLAYGEIMFERGHRDIVCVMKEFNDHTRRFKREDED